MEISLAELQQDIQDLEKLDALAQAYNFEAELQSDHHLDLLRQRLDDPDTAQDEVAKDHLRHDIREAKADFARNTALWLTKARMIF